MLPSIINKHDYAIGCEAFMEVKIGHDRSRKVKIGENKLGLIWAKLSSNWA